jgi:hypothetical protein
MSDSRFLPYAPLIGVFEKKGMRVTGRKKRSIPERPYKLTFFLKLALFKNYEMM